jgi:hypothetical protein
LNWWLDQSGFNKKPVGATTRLNPSDPAGRPMTRATRVIFFQMWNLKPISIYTLCSKKKVMFFQCGIKNVLV